MITTTLNRIRDIGPCADGWQTLLKGLGKTSADNEPLPFARIVEINGLDDALWCCRAEPKHDKEWRLFAAWCARQVQHLMRDRRSINALDVAERYADGQATGAELRAARDAARNARTAVWHSGWAAGATWAAWDVTTEQAGGAARAAAGDAAYAARDSARDAAGAARDAAWAAARDAQTAEFLRIVGEEKSE